MVKSILTGSGLSKNLPKEALFFCLSYFKQGSTEGFASKSIRAVGWKKAKYKSFKNRGLFITCQTFGKVSHREIDYAFIGYCLTRKAYLFLDLETSPPRDIIESIHANFFETVFLRKERYLKQEHDLINHLILHIKLKLDEDYGLALLNCLT